MARNLIKDTNVFIESDGRFDGSKHLLFDDKIAIPKSDFLNKIVTISFDYEAVGACGASDLGAPRAGISSSIVRSSGARLYQELWFYPDRYGANPSTEKGRLYGKINLKGFTLEEVDTFWLGLYIQRMGAGYVKVSNPMLTFEDNEDPWSPAPEDITCYIPSDLEIGTLTATNGALFKKETDSTCIRTTSPINHYFQDFGIRIPDGYKLSVFQYGADGRIVTTSPYSSGDYGFLPLTLSSSAKTLGLVFKKNDDTAVSTQDINNLLGFGSDSVMAQDTKTIAKVVDGTGITNVINYYLASNQATGITVPGGNPNMVRGSSALTMGNGQWSTGTFRISDSGGTVSQIAITDCPASGVTKGIRITSNGTRQIGIAQDGYQMQPGFYTQSWWIKGNAGQKVRVDAYYRDNTDTTGIGQVITLSKTGWNQIIHTAERKSADTLSISYAFLFPTATSGEYIDVAAPMLVRGKFPADWAPAPEDSGWTQTPQQTSDSKRYLWHYRVELHDDGTAVTSPPAVIGVYGQKGDQGNPGTNGTNGANAYVHIAYADSADGVTGFSNTVSTGKTYIGQYSDNSPTHSQDPSKYKWTLIKGADGAQGIPGAKGADGRTPYFHVAYATNATGTSGFSVSDSVGKTYIGQYTDYTSADSTDPTKYSWTLIKGDEGKPALSIAVSASWNRYELTLTAHVYEGGVELNSSQIAAIGAIKWYRNNGSAVVGTGTTITRAEYTRATYEARLEG